MWTRPSAGDGFLFVESEVSLLQTLMRLLEDQEGAKAIYERNPFSESAMDRIARYRCDCAVVNSDYRTVVKTLDIPVLIYGPQTPVPVVPDLIVHGLKRILAWRP